MNTGGAHRTATSHKATTTMSQQNTIAEVRATAEARAATCKMYVNQFERGGTLYREQWAVVSSLWNGRGVYQATTPEGPRMAVGPYINSMPSLYERRDAERLAADFNAMFAEQGKDETVKLVHQSDWWRNELKAAQFVLDTCAGK